MYVQATSRGWLKTIAVVLLRLIHSPSTRKDSIKTLLLMKPPALLLTFVVPALLLAQDPATPAPGATYIPGSLEVPAFVPPVPVEPTKPLTDAEATFVTRDENGVTTTVQRGQASMAPDLPAPELPVEPTTGQLPNLTPRPIHFTLSGTVYDHAVTVAKWQHPVTKEPYEAVLGFDLSYLTGIFTFVRDGITYHPNIFLSHYDSRSPLAQRAAALGRPVIVAPSIAPDSYQLLKGNPQDPAGLQPLLALRDVYLAEKPRLLQHTADLQALQQQTKAWADAHPAPKEDPVFWFKPHRNSRYLTQQDKADQQQAADQRVQQEGEAQP